MTSLHENLFVIIPGFGGPNADTKLDILRRNISTIRAYPWKRLLVRICVYDDTLLPSWLTDDRDIQIIRQHGIIGEFLVKYAKPDDIDPSFDTVMMLLDDILLGTPLPWDKVFQWKKDFNLDIISPCLSKDSKFVYPYMLQNTDSPYSLKVVRVCEFFCYIMDRVAYAKYHSHVDMNNPWMWGLDLIMEKHLKLRVALMNQVLMKHFFHGQCYSQHPNRTPYEGYEYVLSKYGENGDEDLRNQQHTKYLIFDIAP